MGEKEGRGVCWTDGGSVGRNKRHRDTNKRDGVKSNQIEIHFGMFYFEEKGWERKVINSK